LSGLGCVDHLARLRTSAPHVLNQISQHVIIRHVVGNRRFPTSKPPGLRAVIMAVQRRFLAIGDYQRFVHQAWLKELARASPRPDALLVGPGPFLDSQRDLLVVRAAKIAIPAAYETRAAAIAGGLVSYGADVGDGYRQAGIYVGRALKGEKPIDLPVLQATKLELVINLKTAKALGLNLPAKILVLADEVVE
jgi:hypothetical protein